MEAPSEAASSERVVVVGNGMVGHRLCEALVRRRAGRPGPSVVVFGEERQPAYDRVHLGDLLRGRARESLDLARADWYEERGIRLELGDPVVRIDRELRVVVSRQGRCVRYDRLVLATGAVPVVPLEASPRIYHVLRTLDDIGPLAADLSDAESAVVVGGGLLGIETAGTLSELGLLVTLVEVGPQLLGRHVDAETAARLTRTLESRRIRVLLDTRVMGVQADSGGGKRLELSGGARLVTDVIVAAAGVRPRDDLGAAAGLLRHPQGGFVVNDLLQTSDPLIHAIGDCAVHQGIPCGTVAPGYEMAEALASTLLDEPRPFRPSPRSIRLKLPGRPMMLAGEPGRLRAHRVVRAGGEIHRVVALDEERRPVGAIAFGEWRDWNRLEDAIRLRQPLGRREVERLCRTGDLWGEATGRPASAPCGDEAVICACNLVTAGALRAAIARGCRDVRALGAATGAATTCGSCLPAVAALTRGGAAQAAPRTRGLVVLGVAAALLIAAVAAGRSALTAWWPGALLHWEFFLREPAAQQATGFGLLGLALLTLALPLRKRLALRLPGAPELWRLLHAGLGVLLVGAAALHTGLRHGHRLNLALSVAVLALLGSGALSAAGWRRGGWAQAWRWAHLALLWPALGLLAAHVVAVYYY
jgi:nitrite reductase (NADH) large subunit